MSNNNNDSLVSLALGKLSIVTDALIHLFSSEEEYRQYRIEKIEKVLRERYGTDPQSMTFNEDTSETMYSLVRQWEVIRKHKQGDFLTLGFPTVSPDAVMSFYKPAIDKVRGASGMNPDDQKAFLIPAIRKLVHCVHLIPASSSYHHPGVGGLIEHSLELAYYAATSAKGKAFQKIDPVSKTRIQNSRWQFGVILCSFFHDIGKVVTDVTIRNWNKTAVFTSYSSLLWDWILENPGDSYHVYWNGTGKDHEKAMQAMLKFNLFTPETAHWLGNSICKEIESFLQSGGKESIFAPLIAKADMRSTAEDRKMGQWDYRIESGVDRQLHNVFTAFKRLLYATAQSRDERGRPLPIQTENENVVTGWDCNYPDSALFYPDYKHLFIRWDRLLDVRLMMEEFNSGQPLFDLSIKTRDLSSSEKEEARVKVIQALQQSNFLEIPLPGAQAGDGNKGIAWRVRPIDRSTGEILEPVECICLNKAARDELFRDTDPIIFNKNGCCIDWGSAKGPGVENTEPENSVEEVPNRIQEEVSSYQPPINDIPEIDENPKKNEDQGNVTNDEVISELLGTSEDRSNGNEPLQDQTKTRIGKEEITQKYKQPNPSADSSNEQTARRNNGVVNLANLGKMKSFDSAISKEDLPPSDEPKSVVDTILPKANQKSKSSKPFLACGQENRKGFIPPDRVFEDKKPQPKKERKTFEFINLEAGEFTEAELNKTLESLLQPNEQKPKSQPQEKKETPNKQKASKDLDQDPLKRAENDSSSAAHAKEYKTSASHTSHISLKQEMAETELQRPVIAGEELPVELSQTSSVDPNSLIVPGAEDEEIEEEKPNVPTTKVNVRFLGDRKGKLTAEEFLEMLIKAMSKSSSILEIKEDDRGQYASYKDVLSLANEHQVNFSDVKEEVRRLFDRQEASIVLDRNSNKVRLRLNQD